MTNKIDYRKISENLEKYDKKREELIKKARDVLKISKQLQENKISAISQNIALLKVLNKYFPNYPKLTWGISGNDDEVSLKESAATSDPTVRVYLKRPAH